MALRSVVLLGLAAACTALAQTTSQTTSRMGTQNTLQTGTQLVLVPTLVQTSTHDLAFNLAAPDFSLTDNGIPQKLTLEDQSTRPLALVVLIQTGGAARNLFAQYSHLDVMLQQILGGLPNQISIIDFDSAPEGASPFTTNVSEWQDAIDHPDPGDNGAAILDSLAFALRQFDFAPPNARRTILLISQSHDSGSKTRPEVVARALGDSGATLYTLTFSAEKATLEHDIAEPQGHKPYPIHGQEFYAYFELTPALKLALGAMKSNAAGEIAGLTGGESAHFSGRAELDQSLNALANHIRNTYLLSFTPSAPTPGIHTLAVQLNRHPGLQLSSRTIYSIPALATRTTRSNSP